jgi:hypothetical protein
MEYKMADKKTYKTASGAQQYGSTEDFKKQKDASFKRFLENPTTKNALMENMMGAGYYGARSKEFNSDTYGELEQLLSGFAKDTKDKLKKEEKPKAGPKGNVKKMAEGGKTGMRGQVKKDDMNKKAVNSAVKEAMDSKYEGKINPPKEPDMGVAKARMSRPTGPDRKEMAYNRRRSASEGRTVSKMAMGGKCRGMGAATKGGSFSKNG